MRIFEVVLLIALLLSAAGMIFLKNAKYKAILPALSTALSLICIFVEGFRFAMAPTYILSVVLFVLSLIRLVFQSNRKRPVLKVLGIVGLCIALLISSALPVLLPVVDLPAPSGQSPVGTMIMDFTEPERKDILSGKSSPQKIAVRVWYPASGLEGKKRANWMENRREASLMAKMFGFPDIIGQLCLTKTNSYWNAAFSDNANACPVVLFSGGSGAFNGINVIQMEELASHGYVVFAVSHPYKDFAVVYSDGSITAYNPSIFAALGNEASAAVSIAKKQGVDESSLDFDKVVLQNEKIWNKDLRVCSDDMIFAADEVFKLNDGTIPSIFKSKLDVVHMGIFGHSEGGMASSDACLRDSRFKAFIDLDGVPIGDSTNHVISQPFMVICRNGRISQLISDSYSKQQKNYLKVNVMGAEHSNFTDININLSNAGRVTGLLGSINAYRQEQIMNTYILSFFNKHLKGIQEPILDASKSPYPEVTIEKK